MEVGTYERQQVHLGSHLALVCVALQPEGVGEQGVQLVLAIQQQPNRWMCRGELGCVQLGRHSACRRRVAGILVECGLP